MLGQAKAPSSLRFAGALQKDFRTAKQWGYLQAIGLVTPARGDARSTSAELPSGEECQAMYYTAIFVSRTLTGVQCERLTR